MTRPEVFPLSHPQKLVWLSQRINAGIPLYHIAFSWRIHGDLDPARFSQAFERAVAGIDALRTLIRTGPDMEPYAVILPEIDATPVYRDTRNDPGVRKHLKTYLDGFIWLPFDPDERLFNTWLFRLGEREYHWVLTTHHSIWDGISNRLLFDRVAAAYAGQPIPEEAPPFRSVMKAFSQPDPEAQAFWDRRLPELSQDFAFYGRSPGDRVHPTARFERPLEPQRLEAIDRLGMKGGSPEAIRFYFFSSIYAVYLSRLSGLAKPTVGMVYHGRRRPEHQSIPGFFSRVLPLQAEIAAGDRLPDVMRNLRDEASTARKHARGDVANSRRERIIHASANLRIQRFPDFAGMPVEADALHSGWNEFSLVLNIHNFSDERLTVGLDISKTLLGDEQREEAAARFHRLVDFYLENPDAGVAAGPILSKAERRSILIDRQPPRRPVPEISLAERFAAIAREQPDRPAFLFRDRTMTYRALDRASGALAAAIRAQTGAEAVGICLEPGPDVPLAVLAVLKSGRGFVMVPPDLPEVRRRLMLRGSGADLVISHSRHRSLFVGLEERLLCVDEIPAEAVSPAADGPGARPSIDGLLYVVYTSGSTGQPKGVRVPQRQLLNMLAARQETYPAAADEVLCHKTYLGFVDSTVELFEGLLQGVPTLLLDEATLQDPELLVAALAEAGVTRARFVPDHLKTLVETVPDIGDRLPALRLIANTAASIRPADLAHFVEAFPGRTFINTFGLSELLSVAAGEIRPEDAVDGRLPIGAPIPNRLIYVLDPWLEPVPPGVPGDLYLGGDDLALGFVDLPEEDGRRFLPNPFEPGGRLFRTGDLARWRPDGRLEHIGRRDHQVKVRGQRVELAEVEGHLEAVAGVRQAAVAAVSKDGRTVLVGYVVLEAGAPDPVALRAELAGRLPDYMIPPLFVTLETMPLTRSGKIDRGALPEPDLSRRRGPGGGSQGEMSATERRLGAIWEAVLGIDGVGRHENFFLLGGDSLLAIRIQHRVETDFKVRIPVAAFIQASTVAEQAALVDAAGDAPLFGRRLIALRKEGRRPPMFLVPPAGSTVLAFRQLAHHLSPDQPVYGLQPWGTDGEMRPHYSLRRMASDYIREMRKLHPEGPYLLGGMCFGGIVVFEMARQLARGGEPPPLVVVLDTLVPPNMRIRERFLGLGRMVKRALLGRPYAPNQVMRRLQGQTALGEMAAEEMGEIDRVFQANAFARFLYGGVHYPGRLDVLFSAARPGYGRRADWRLAAAEVVVHEIPGAHSVNESILREPNVQALAEKVEELINGLGH
ncbi:MAG TPA: AMP-binding protein [Anaerolineales bacterium]|nr:AMP-binding protein [Anaerolineales bacterium]